MSDLRVLEQELEMARFEAKQAAERVELESRALLELSTSSATILGQLQSRGIGIAKTDAREELNADLKEGGKRVRDSADEYHRRLETYLKLFEAMQHHTGQTPTNERLEG